MMQTVEAVIDKTGRIHLLENVEVKSVRRAFVTLLPDSPQNSLSAKGSLQNLGEILDDDLETASREITETFKKALEKSAKELAD